MQNRGIQVARKCRNRQAITAFCGLVLCIFSLAAWADQDVVLVLDASARMHANAAVVAQAVADFTDSRGPDTHIAVVEYAKTAAVLVPLMSISDASRRLINTSLRRLEYSNQLSDTTSGLERGLAEIVNHGNGNARRSIVLVTDDFVNLGNAAAARDRTRWIMQSLVPTAVYNHVRIYAATFSAGAILKTLQSLTQKTGGSAFRVTHHAGLADVFRHINADMMNISSLSAPISPGQVTPLIYPPASTAPEIAAQFNAPLTHQDIKPAHIRWLWLMGLLALIAGSFGIYMAWNIMRHIRIPRKPAKPLISGGEGPRAVLYDISNPNDIKRFELAERSTLLGRVAGYDPEVQYVLVKEKTVGRCHAVIEKRGHSFWIMDQGSINGTFVNGERITTDRALKHGDIVAIHRHEFEFMIPEYFESESTVVGMREQLAG
jgi:FHA domain/von Willebrand factor type A domain